MIMSAHMTYGDQLSNLTIALMCTKRSTEYL